MTHQPALHVCPWWAAYTFDHRARRLLQKPERILGPYVRAGMTVLDLGCGMGFFSIGMAKLVGDSGRIIAIDLQQKMLDVLMKRAGRSGVARRIQPYRCEPDDIGVHGPGDFALAFYMFHEVPKQHRFLEQLRRSLKPAAGFLLVEPAIHVRKNAFEESIAVVQSCGFLLRERPVVRLSHAALFEYANG